ncbi:hypothetical protein [Methanobrevibacter sp.]|uniref:hypothetical protein n=1 Tax=Methanobrevibacter sp. TaxID=66852 RepID=UPI0026E1063B|nr:hypothetical protein [Methanobrevibacter sp.]MDO5860994.1 hypothetical protein [Methanobrevibacter sp.]
MDSFEELIGLNVDDVDLDESDDFIFCLGYKYKNCGQRYPATKLKLADLDYFNFIEFVELFKSEAIFIIWYDEKSRIITDLEIYYLSNDFDVLFKDYYYILSAVRDGNAHKLREGDTKYLGASRMNEKVRQPNSDILANRRELVLKRKYLQKILNEISVRCK